MKGRRIALALLLCAVMGAYFLRLYARPAASTVPLTQVFAYAAPTQAPAAQSYRERRDAQRAQEMAALEKISQESAEAILSLCASIADVTIENVVILDECGYL